MIATAMTADRKARGFQLVALDISVSVYFYDVIHTFATHSHSNAFIGGRLDGQAESPAVSLVALLVGDKITQHFIRDMVFFVNLVLQS